MFIVVAFELDVGEPELTHMELNCANVYPSLHGQYLSNQLGFQLIDRTRLKKTRFFVRIIFRNAAILPFLFQGDRVIQR